jgi:cysteine desulfurase
MPVYLDHAATTPMLSTAVDAYSGALRLVGNPSSIHSQGQNARRMLEEARETVAASLGAEPVEVVFTSGGTESVNLGIKGLFWARNATGAGGTPDAAGARGLPRPRILVPRAEHHATIDAVEWLERHEGAVVEWVPVDEVGRVRLDVLERMLAPEVALVTLLTANNEVGTIQPVDEVVALAARHGVPVHADAVSSFGHLPVDFSASGLAALSVSAHKVGGPFGIGALVLARSATAEPLIHGGGQQRARSGTQDAPGAVAFAAAVSEGHPDLTALRDRVIDGVRAAVPEAVLRGDPVDRLPNNAHFTFPGCAGDSLLLLLDMAGVSVSTGSACQAGIPEPSHVLLAMGLTENEARGALRITVGRTTTEADVDALLSALPDAVGRARRAGYSDRLVGAGA